jgi:hypothetical protein
MAWLWTDTLAALLLEHDGVAPESVAAWVQRPSAYRLPDGCDPLSLARQLLARSDDLTPDRRSGIPQGGGPPPPTR